MQSMITNWQEQRERLAREKAEREELRQRPGAVSMVVNYTSSTTKWVSTGARIRTDEEVNRISEICANCPQEYFKDGVCVHPTCGCGVMSSAGEKATLLGRLFGGSMVNKIRRTSEHCPIGEW